MAVTIKKAKIKKGDLLQVEYEEATRDGQATVSKECNARIHQDLRDAFRLLNTHVSALCEQWDPNGACYLETGINCTGYTLGGADDHAGVTLIGQRELANNRILNLVSPFLKWQDENAPYDGADELYESIEQCNKEVYAYLFEGKHAPNPQLDLFAEALNEEAFEAEETPLDSPGAPVPPKPL